MPEKKVSYEELLGLSKGLPEGKALSVIKDKKGYLKEAWVSTPVIQKVDSESTPQQFSDEHILGKAENDWTVENMEKDLAQMRQALKEPYETEMFKGLVDAGERIVINRDSKIEYFNPNLNKSLELNLIKSLYANRFGSTTGMRKNDMILSIMNAWNNDFKPSKN